MKKIAFAFAAVLSISTFGVSTADAMNIGSLSRQRPLADSAELTTSSIPAICHDRACGVGNRGAADFTPVVHMIFASISGLVRSHLDFAFAGSEQARVQLISTASAD